MSSTLDNMRRGLNALIAEGAAALDAERLRHERQLASAMEALSQESAVRAAYADGRSDERSRCLALINDHLRTLNRTGINALALEALRDAVEGA